MTEPTVRDVLNEVRAMRRDVVLVKEHLTGNGEPEKGLNFRVPALEREVEGIKNNNASAWGWIKATGTAALLALGGWVWTKIVGNPPSHP